MSATAPLDTRSISLTPYTYMKRDKETNNLVCTTNWLSVFGTVVVIFFILKIILMIFGTLAYVSAGIIIQDPIEGYITKPMSNVFTFAKKN